MLRFLYALFFMVVLPLGLLGWDHLASIHFSASLCLPTSWGIALLGLGGCLFVWSMATLMRYGQGLPMNAFPPLCFVSQGPYHFFSHPIYVGFCLMVYGIAILYQSSAGFFLVAPIVVLSVLALVWGYEQIDLETRFTGLRTVPFIGLVLKKQQTPLLMNKVKAVLSLGLLGLFLLTLSMGSWEKLTNTQLPFLGVSLLGAGSCILRHKQFAQITCSSYQMASLLLTNTLQWLIAGQVTWPALGWLLS